jgi:dipeptidyl aminopeptidase/acylaminoacyl peptidase
MRIRSSARVAALVVVAVAAMASSMWTVRAQSVAKRPLTYDVYESWKTITPASVRLSDDGQWFAYSVTSVAEDGELIVRNLKSGQEFKQPRGTAPQITPDSKFVIFTIVPPKSDADANAAGGGAAEPAAGAAPAPAAAGGGQGAGAGAGAGGAATNRNSVGIMALPSGQVTTVEQIASFRLPAESSEWLALQKGRAGGGGGRNGAAGGGRAGGGGGGRAGGGAGGGGGQGAAAAGAAAPTAQAPAAGRGAGPATPQEKTKPAGNDLIVRNLTTGQDFTIAEVSEFAWHKNGSWLMYAVSSTDAAKDGAFARNMADGSVKALHTGKGHYKSFSFDEDGKQLLFMSDEAEYAKPVSPYRVYYWKPSETAATEILSAATRGVPQGQVIADSAPRFTEDGARVLVMTGAPPAPTPTPTPEPNAPRKPAPLPVDVWSYKDPQIQPMQKVRVQQDQNRTYRAIYHLSNKQFVQLATADLPNVNPGFDATRALGTSDLPYRQEMSWDQTYNDVYLVDLKTGARRRVLDHTGSGVSMSPGGKYLMFYDEEKMNWFTQDIASGVRVNLTERLPVKFYDEGHDTPDAPTPLGTAGWTDGDKSVILYDKYDIWEIRPDGSNARNITGGEGRKQQLVFRYRNMEVPAPRTIPTDKPMLLTTTNDETKATGYYRVPFSGGTPEKIVMMDKLMGAIVKAKNADVVVFTEQKFSEFPDYWVSDMTFASPKKITNANPQQAEYVWGNAENVKYINSDGKVLNAMLIKPDNFDPTKKYPMMVYIYEELTQGLHRYVAPNVGTSINVSRYVSNGYVVLQPDISYETGYPGPSAMKCVIPAINTIVAKGYIDPKRIGIQGHSWGGYQITYMITQTNLFAAVEAGASVSNMISAYGGIRWGTGMVRQFQYEKTQSRIGEKLWDAPLQYIENSPIFWVERIHTPYLSIHNDGDDAVPWYQGIEFNMAMRRLGKEAYMFNYNGQPHGLSNRDYQKHWTVHMDEFFDHYLLGKPRPSWMDTGVSYMDRGARDVSGMFKKPINAPAASGEKKGGGW